MPARMTFPECGSPCVTTQRIATLRDSGRETVRQGRAAPITSAAWRARASRAGSENGPPDHGTFSSRRPASRCCRPGSSRPVCARSTQRQESRDGARRGALTRTARSAGDSWRPHVARFCRRRTGTARARSAARRRRTVVAVACRQSVRRRSRGRRRGARARCRTRAGGRRTRRSRVSPEPALWSRSSTVTKPRVPARSRTSQW